MDLVVLNHKQLEQNMKRWEGKYETTNEKK